MTGLSEVGGPELRRRIAAALDRHTPSSRRPVRCTECGYLCPCPTVELLTGSGSPQPGAKFLRSPGQGDGVIMAVPPDPRRPGGGAG